MSECARGCTIRDQHLATCEGNCRGCLPQHTERMLCERCEKRLATNLNNIIDAWEDLHKQVARTNGYSLKDRITGTPEVGLVLNDRVMEVMTEVRDWALFVARVISEESTAGYPVNPKTDSMLLFIVKNLWFVEMHELAGEFVADSGRLWSVVERQAYPTGSRKMRFDVPCQVVVDGAACGGQLFAVVRANDDKLPSAIYCKKDKAHQLPPSEWVQFGIALRA